MQHDPKVLIPDSIFHSKFRLESKAESLQLLGKVQCSWEPLCLFTQQAPHPTAHNLPGR